MKKNKFLIKPFIGIEEKKNVIEALDESVISGFSGDHFVKKFESEFAGYYGEKYAVATNSGTAALHSALAACGIEKGDEVITTPYTFIATTSAIMQQNATPVFVDIEPSTLGLDPSAIQEKITSRTKAILVVHLYGYPAKIREITAIARKNGLILIEDCAQAHGAKTDNKLLGTFGHIACFSFSPSKNMTCGEGGMVLTNNRNYAKECLLLRQNGKEDWRTHRRLGYNYRMTELQAAIGLAQLSKLEKMNKIRERNARTYIAHLRGLDLEFLQPGGSSPAYYKLPVLVGKKSMIDRDDLVNKIKRKGLPIEEGYPYPLYKIRFVQDYLKEMGVNEKIECKTAEDISSRIFNLFTSPSLNNKIIREVCSEIERVYR